MMSDFEGKVAVITGGAQGIGRCIAEMFREQGAAACRARGQVGRHSRNGSVSLL